MFRTCLFVLLLLTYPVSAQSPERSADRQYVYGDWFLPIDVVGPDVRLELWVDGKVILEGIGPAGPRSRFVDKQGVQTILAAEFTADPSGTWALAVANHCDQPLEETFEANYWLASMSELDWTIGLSIVGCDRILLKTYHFLAFDKEVVDGDCEKFCMKSAPSKK